MTWWRHWRGVTGVNFGHALNLKHGSGLHCTTQDSLSSQHSPSTSLVDSYSSISLVALLYTSHILSYFARSSLLHAAFYVTQGLAISDGKVYAITPSCLPLAPLACDAYQVSFTGRYGVILDAGSSVCIFGQYTWVQHN